MDLLVPNYFLTTWVIVIAINYLFGIIAIFKIIDLKSDFISKAFWVAAIIIIPFVGIISYIRLRRVKRLQS